MFFKKLKCEIKIRKYKKQIAQTEKRRIRSQAALIEAILQNKTPNDVDVDYFNQYTNQIEYFRTRIHEMQEEMKQE